MDEIIVGVDESATAKIAAKQAAELAQQLGKPLHLVMALKRRQASSFSTGSETMVIDNIAMREPMRCTAMAPRTAATTPP